MDGAELKLAASKRFANSNAMLFAFFPERRRGVVDVEGAKLLRAFIRGIR
jgi:hypothetical protein